MQHSHRTNLIIPHSINIYFLLIPNFLSIDTIYLLDPVLLITQNCWPILCFFRSFFIYKLFHTQFPSYGLRTKTERKYKNLLHYFDVVLILIF